MEGDRTVSYLDALTRKTETEREGPVLHARSLSQGQFYTWVIKWMDFEYDRGIHLGALKKITTWKKER